MDTETTEMTMVTGQTLHIVTDVGISAASAIGGSYTRVKTYTRWGLHIFELICIDLLLVRVKKR